jgi:hypothetical protein
MPTKKAVAEVAENLEVVEEVVDKAIEGVDALDHASHVAAVATKRGLRVLKRPQSVAVILGLTGVVVGAGLGVGAYFLLRKRLSAKYEAYAQQEIEEVRASYKRRVRRQEYNTPEEAAEAMHAYQGEDIRPDFNRLSPREQAEVKLVVKNMLGEETETKVIRGRGGEPGYVEVETETTIEENEFIDDRPINPFDWNQDVELSKRDPESPYVISFEEFNENSTDWEQNNLVYYEEDDVLADERDNPVPEIEATVGYDNLKRFGHGSKDPNVVYIRNERTEALFEIIRNPGSFSDQVVGLKHSDSPRKRRGRRDWGDDE